MSKALARMPALSLDPQTALRGAIVIASAAALIAADSLASLLALA